MAIKLMRGIMEWPQETLEEISGLTARTIQCVEAGHPQALIRGEPLAVLLAARTWTSSRG
jgi:hypothetical protein